MSKRWVCSVAWISLGLPEPLTRVRIPADPLFISLFFRKLLKHVKDMTKIMAVTIDEEKCTACGACVEACPVEALKVNEKCKVNADTCIDCGTCVDECPVEAITL